VDKLQIRIARTCFDARNVLVAFLSLARVAEAIPVISSDQNPESLVRRIRALADKRQKEATRERRGIAHELLGAADGYRAIADALERQQALARSLAQKGAAKDSSDDF
jgi:hypothetical protein